MFYPIKMKYLATCLVLNLLSHQAYSKNTDIFSEQLLSLPFNVTQPVKAANVLPTDGMELIAVGINQQQQRKMAILAMDPQSSEYQQVAVFDIANDVFAYDFGEQDEQGLSHVYLLSKLKIQKLLPSHNNYPAQWLDVQAVSSYYLGDFSDVLVHQDFAMDINGDKQDDFLLPHFEYFNLWLSGCCEVRHQLSLPIAARFQRNWGKVTYAEEQLYFQDMNQDQNNDIVVVEQGRLAVFEQIDNKTFASQPRYVQIDSTITNLEWWDSRDSNGQKLDQSNLSHKKVERILDINGDKLPDLAVKSTQSSGVLDKNIEYQFYYAQLSEQGIVYKQKHSSNISHSKTLNDLGFVDLQQDGKFEVAVSSFDIGISQIISALLSGSIDQEVMVFQMDEQNQFGKKPIVDQSVELTFSLSSGKQGQPLTKVADINGDQVKDIVYSDGTEQLKVLLATPGQKRPFSRRAIGQKITLPKEASRTAVQDLNGDNKADLVFNFGSTNEDRGMHQIAILVAN